MPMHTDMIIWKNFITIPTTAMGICAYSASPKTGSSAPYFLIILFVAAIAATRDICARKLQMPSGINLFITLPQSLNEAFSSFTERIWNR